MNRKPQTITIDWRSVCRTALLTVLALGPASSEAAADAQSVTVGRSRFVRVPESTNQITVGNPEIADVQLLKPNMMHVFGKRLGSTNVILCSKASCFQSMEVEVTHDLDGLKRKLHDLFPQEHPQVLSSQGAIVMAGQVSSLQKMDAILKIANTFAPRGEQQPSEYQTGNQTTLNLGDSIGNGRQSGSSPAAPQGQATGVINLMQVGGPQQVMLGVTVAEVDRRLSRNLKVDFSAVGGAGDFSSGTVSGTAAIDALTKAMAVAPSLLNPYAVFFRFIGHDAAVKTVINAAKDNGLAKVLAEPNLTVISGQDADFLSGGEFPIPVPQNIGVAGAGTITIQFKPFGVSLKFLPVVLDSGRISMKLNIDVSELSSDNAVALPAGNSNESFVIPSLNKRSANTSLELDDGQTLGIAGLISDSLRENISKFPGLGDIPILGQLFTSQSFLRNETELLIFVTPHLVKPISPDRIELPTDRFAEPSDMEFYLMGRTEAAVSPPRVSAPPNTGGLRGHFGQQP